VHAQEQKDRCSADGRERRMEHVRNLGRYGVAPVPHHAGKLNDERRR
jgi:hypothetical protein